MKRVIGSIEGNEKGPLLILLGAIHGNEPAGVKAIDYIIKMLQVEPITNPGFSMKGKIIGLIGNRRAFAQKERFIDLDLNRHWLTSTINKINTHPKENLLTEEKEIKELYGQIMSSINRYKPSNTVLLDIHTTSSFGGIFVIPGDSHKSLEIAKDMNAPVVNGLLNGVTGTTMHFFNKKVTGLNIDAITFEAGQHTEVLSVNRAIAAIINCMKSIKMVRYEDVENIHNEILIKYSEGLPKVTEIIFKYSLNKGEYFKMVPGFRNFEVVKKNTLLAHNNEGEVRAPHDGRLLMPLYQKLGSEGFFIVKEVLED